MDDQTKTNKCGRPQRATLYLKNRRYKIFEGHNIIGRNTAAAVNIKDISISKSHAIITVINSGQHFIADNNSINGTNLNTNVLTPFKLYQLEDNDDIKFADVSAVYMINCPEGDSQNSENTQSSQITEDLYTKLTQQIHIETQRNSPPETEIVSTTSSVADQRSGEHNQTASNSRSNFNTTSFHEATTQLIDNDASPLEDEISSTRCGNSFHYAETQVIDFPVPFTSGNYEAEASSMPTSSQSKTSDSTKCNDNDNTENSGKENTCVDSSGTETSPHEHHEDNVKNHSQSSNTESSSREGNDNISHHSQIDINDSNESVDFMMLQKADEIESQLSELHVELLQRKKRTVLDTDDENNELQKADEMESQLHVEMLQRKKRTVLDTDDENNDDNMNNDVGIENRPTTSHGNTTLPCSPENLSNLPTKDTSKVDSDCETYIEEGDDLNADHNDFYNDTNVIPPTQEDLSEVFNYKSKSPRREQTTNHTFESSEDSFRLGLTQLLKDKADISQTMSANSISKSSGPSNELNDVTQQLVTNLPSTSGTNQQCTFNQTETNNDSSMSKDDQMLVCSTPIQKDVCREIKQERSPINDSADADDDVYLANTQCVNQDALETYNIYAQPTQKLSFSKKNVLQLKSSSKQNQSQAENINKEYCESDTDDEIYIENTQPVTENIYVKSTQKLPSKFEALSRPTSTKQSTLGEKVDSVFLAETELIAQNVKLPENIINKPHKEGTERNIESPIASTSKVSLGNRGEEGQKSIHTDNAASSLKSDNLNHIYSLETQLIAYPKAVDADICDDNLETQIEVSFSQDNAEPTRKLSDRPTNPLVVILKGDTQEDPVDENASQNQTSDKNPSDIQCIETNDLNDNNTVKIDERVSSPKSNKTQLSTSKTPGNTSSSANENSNVSGKTTQKPATTESTNEGCDITKEGSELNSRSRVSTRKSGSNETSELQDTNSHNTRLRGKRSQNSPTLDSTKSCSVTNEPEIKASVTNERTVNKADKHVVTLPKKRRLLNIIPENIGEGQSTIVDTTTAKRSKRKVLTNVDDVECEAKAVDVTPETTSTVSRKYTRSAGTSNSSEVSLLAKSTRRGKITMPESKGENDKSSQSSSTNELEKSSKVHKKAPVVTEQTESAKNSRDRALKSSDVKVTSKRISTRNRKNSDKSNENDGELPQGIKDVDKKVPSGRKRKTTLERLPSEDSLSDFASPVTTRTSVNVPKAQTPSTSRRESYRKIEDIQIKGPSGRKRKTTLEKFPSTDSLSTSASPVGTSTAARVVQAQTPSSNKRRKQKPIQEFEISLSSSSETLKSSGTLSALNTPERKKRTLKPKVVFTMMDSPLLESAIRHLGGSVVDSIAACTVLVTEKVKRTLKLLTAIGNAKPICSPEWIHESKKARQFLDPWDFILRDPEAEEKWNFSLSDSLRRSTSKMLLEGLSFHVNATDNVADVLKSAIESSGGKCLNRITKADATKKIYLVTSQECKSKSAKLRKQHKNLIAIDPEGIFESVLRQELVLENHVIEV